MLHREPTTSRRDGLLLVGHGSREPAGNADFLRTARLVAELGQDRVVEPAFLEFAEPTIAQAFDALVLRGVERIVVAPLLLFSAGHVQRDIPAEIAAAREKYLGLEIEQVAHLGCHPRLIGLSQSRYDEALQGRCVAADCTALVLVGRGSHDAEATAEMFKFAELRSALIPCVHTRVAFVAMAAPSLPEVLAEVVAGPWERIVVQPHLLFGGVLTGRISDHLREFIMTSAVARWSVAQPLGVSRELAAVVLDRANTPAAQAE